MVIDSGSWFWIEGVHTDTAIMFENSLHCHVRNYAFENIGGYTLWRHLDSPRNVFDRNTFRHPLNPDLGENVTYACERSTDLAEWRVSGGINVGGTRVTVVSSPPDGNGIVTVVLTITEGPPARLFGRLAAQHAP